MSNHERSSGPKEKSPTFQDRLKKIGGRKLLVTAVIAGGLVIGGFAYFNHVNKGSSSPESSRTQTQNPDESEQSGSDILDQWSQDAQEDRTKIPEKAESYGGIQPELSGDSLAKAFEIPTGLSSDEYASAFINRLNALVMYGATPATAEKIINGNLSADEENKYLADLVSKNTKSFDDALFAKDMAGTLNKDTFLEYIGGISQSSASIWGRTLNKSQDSEPFVTSFRTTEVLDRGTSDGMRSLTIYVTASSNTDKNRGSELGSKFTSDGASGQISIRTKPVGGVDKIHIFDYTVPR